MCEVMANGPHEENSNYVLTEDMIDAAMTQHISYQDDVSDNGSSQDGIEEVEVDEDSQDSLDDLGCTSSLNTGQQQERNRSIKNVKEPSSQDTNAMTVLVIETGLGKSQSDCTEKENHLLNEDPESNIPHTSRIQNTSHTTNSEVDCNSYHENELLEPISTNGNSLCEVQNCNKGVQPTLPLLKQILTDNHISSSNSTNGEPIDLCESDTDEMSEDEVMSMDGLIDDELKSVMESNLMAEVGITVNKQSPSKSTQIALNLPTNCTPKISVKSMAQQSSANILTNKTKNTIAICSNNSDNVSFNSINKMQNNITDKNSNSQKFDINFGAKNQTTSSIHINKIAVPNKTFVNSQRKKIKCVYVKNPMPFVINSQQSVGGKNLRFMLNTSQVQKLPTQLTPIAALTNMTSKPAQFQKLLPKPSNNVNVAPGFLKPNILKNNLSVPPYFNQDSDHDETIKSLMFHNLMKPYAPPNIDPSTSTYDCLECHDKFVLESSLAVHMARRSALISYWCRVCAAESTFYNRCSLLKHLRGHNITITHIDTGCIKFSPLTKEIIEKGAFSTVLEDCSITSQEAITTRTNNSQDENLIISTTSGLSKSTCTQVKSPLLVKQIFSATSTNQNHPRPLLTYSVARNRKLAVVPSIQNQSKAVVANKISLSSLLLSNQLQSPSHEKNVPLPCGITQKSVSVTTSKDDENEIIIDDDICEKINTNLEAEEIDVTNITSENNNKDKKLSPIRNVQPKRALNTKSKVKNSSPNNKFKSQKRNCSECGMFCFNINKHLNGLNRPTKLSLACKVCQLIMPTRCALQIHHRIHVKMPPFKCPDCGKDFDSWNELNPHLKLSCGHFAKCVRYLCSACKAHFNSGKALGQHISEKHSRDIFRCPVCPVAFFGKPSLISHFTSKHPNEKIIGGEYKQCTMCPPRKLIAINEFAKHIDDHHTRNTNNWIYGYKCSMCNVVYANKMAFIIHQLKEKSMFDSNCNKNASSSKSLQIEPETDLSMTNAESVSDSNSDIEDEPTIIQKSPIHFDVPTLSEKDPLSLEDWEDTSQQRVKEKREELCIVCKTNFVTLLPGIDLNEQSLCCKQCVKPLDPESIAIRIEDCNSFKRKKTGLKPSHRSLSSDEKVSVAKKRRASDVSLSNGSVESSDIWSDNVDLDPRPAKKKSRKKPYKERTELDGQIQGQVITSQSPDELVCSKCDFSDNNRGTFLDHIKTHRSDPNDFQCQECGLCFVVLPSLERHLQVHHSIKDVNSYIQHNLSCLPQKVILPEDVEDNHQCRVCHEMFDSNSSLEKHFRTHGMAFMSSLSKSP